MTVQEIRENYRKFDDWKIKELASDPKTLRKDIIPILNEEITRRNLGVDLIKWVNLETNSFIGQELKNLTERIRRSQCSNCLKKSKLYGYEFTTIISALITITNKTESQIICKDCARKKRINSMTIKLLFGWWSKSGFIMTPITLVSDLFKIFRTELNDKEVINEFIVNNTGALRKADDNGTSIDKLLFRFNNLSKQ